MFFSVLLCFLVTIVIQLELCNIIAAENRFECGAHGKFEYCIDDIPGCVIGCHCHPGYYFDTDTKICEHNSKLTHDFRRRYLPDPTRVYVQPVYTPTVTEPLPTPTGTDTLDDNVDEKAKDTDNLGDWLYNQFFKTIENQVINNTHSDTKPLIQDKEKIQTLTRRSGNDLGPVTRKSKRKARKSMKSSGKRKKHKKVHGLRRKLLRITEDDSLFDSESGSDDSDMESDSDSSDDDDSESDSSDDSDKSDDSSNSKERKRDPSTDDKDHGHKKVIIFNRRPKLPLPSFIFLPSMDTPYYPPIGLPAPPALPMYPMVPVPPMAPIFPFPGCDNVTNNQNGETTTTTTTTTTENTPNDTPVDPPSTETSTEAVVPPQSLRMSQKIKRSRLEKHQNRRPKLDKPVFRSREPGISSRANHKQRQRNEIIQKLKHRIKEKKSRTVTPPPPEPSGEEQPIGDLLDERTNSLEAFTSRKRKLTKSRRGQFPKLADVDFKYLSELIHRVNQNETKNKLRSLPFDLNEDLKDVEKNQNTRRNYNPYNVEPTNVELNTSQHRNLHTHRTDDGYYTSLGRQIATMIRNADSKLDQVDNTGANRQVPFHSVLHENNHVPQSYSERAVRSPLAQNNPDYLDEIRTLKHSGEKNLLNLENEFEVFATTQPPMSLQELENILNTMQKVRAHITIEDVSKNRHLSNLSLNINLLPKYEKKDNSFGGSISVPKYVVHKPLSNNYIQLQPVHATNITVSNEQIRKTDIPFSNFWMFQHSKPVESVTPKNITDESNNESLPHNKQIYYNTFPRSSHLPTETIPNDRQSQKTKNPHAQYLQVVKSVPLKSYSNSLSRPEPQLKPKAPLVNYHTLKYFTGSQNHYMFEKATFPLQMSPFRNEINKPFDRSASPSYFHHELHHFDYFE